MTADQDQEDAQTLIASLIRQTGLSVTEIARRAGIAPSTLTRIYPKPSVKYTLSARTLSKLRRLQSTPDTPEARPSKPMAAVLPAVHESRAAFETRREPSLNLYRLVPTDPPAQGALAEADLEFLSGDLVTPVERIAWPLPHSGEDRHLLIYMADDSMMPRFRSGDYLLVDRLRPPAAGNEVLVVFADTVSPDPLHCVAQLVDRNRGQLRLKQYNEGVVATVMRRDVTHVYAIVGSFDDTVRR